MGCRQCQYGLRLTPRGEDADEKRQVGRVFLNGYIEVPARRQDAVKAALPRQIALTRQEAGCILFDVAENDAIPGRFVVSEVFASDAAFELHQDRTKTSEWHEIKKGVPRDYSIHSENSDP